MASVLYTVFISPLELVLEVLFELIFRIFRSRPQYVGFAIIGVSIAVSLLSLPLYRRADVLQKRARDKQRQMEGWISHIRRTFKGNERFMMLQYYYKLNNYSPFSALECAIPLLLQIPFFTAAYHFLSHLEILKGASFWIFKDLGSPDSLFQIGSFSVNVLPVLMTAFNCVSALLYLRGFAFKDKLQTYGMAALFLVLLYRSPSGLVLYWTCNNIFSLVKNIFYKLKHPRETAYILSAVVGNLLSAAVLISGLLNSRKKIIAILLFQYLSMLPLICYLTKNYLKKASQKASLILGEEALTFKFFFLPGVLMSLLFGVLIPSAVITSSPAEFVNLSNYQNPFLFLIYSTCYAIGFFLVWMGIIRHMLTPGAKQVLYLILWVVSGCFLLNYMCFGRDLGLLSPLLVFETGVRFSKAAKLINLAAIFGLSIILMAVFRFRKMVLSIYVVLILCIGSISGYQIYTGQKDLHSMDYIKSLTQKTDIKPIIPLSKKGKNVIVFMLDRAISGYVPYLLEEKPILKRQFDGFTYYPNTLSFGRHTNFAAPALFGGYEYTPVEMNKRPNELLKDKHDEALKMLPVLFGENHYKVTVCDPPLAGYKGTIPDISIFNEYPYIRAHRLSGVVKDKALEKNMQELPLYRNRRNFFCYSVFKTLPLFISKLVYDRGDYLSQNSNAIILPKMFYEYSVLTLLTRLTQIEDTNDNTFLSIQNATPHQLRILQLPDYELKETVNNDRYKIAIDGHLPMDSEVSVTHYHVNMATFLQLGKWFDFMRENGVYDNTRIILVADHGYHYLRQFDYMIIEKIYDKAVSYAFDVSGVNPLLMVKDFNSTGFTTSDEFMTNADTPVFAVKDVIDNPINPFTGKEISDKEKTAHPQVITTSRYYGIIKNGGTVFDTSDGDFLSVHDDIFNPDNWEVVGPGTAP